MFRRRVIRYLNFADLILDFYRKRLTDGSPADVRLRADVLIERLVSFGIVFRINVVGKRVSPGGGKIHFVRTVIRNGRTLYAQTGSAETPVIFCRTDVRKSCQPHAVFGRIRHVR